ncbi:MAG TPA: lysine 5,6-aminomutase subunit alpha [Candidatus Limnocylindrales bacterium]|nr:lysine 5,6-aminomutase subunit alpha [Candidatus Limnocylindrales bacterium]
MQPIGDPEELEALQARATTLAGAWGAAAAAATSAGQERAVLRLFGVAGVDRAGRPLAAEVVDRWLTPDPRRLGGGISLPFAIAMAEYDLRPHELALELAAGNVDLGLEAELLRESDRRAVAVSNAAALARAALERVDANRIARRELLGLLGDPPRPWLGTTLRAPAIVDALDEARAAIDAGVELVRVDVPPTREFAERMARLGAPVESWRASESSRGGLDTFDPAGPPIPTGSHRALSVLRRFVDEAGARRRGYVRLATDAPALAAPDQAVVAAFERIDLVVADPMREIVAGRVDPDRALADHVFAHRLLSRAGTRVLVPAGPLLVAPDLATGVPSGAATRSGRALALQLLAVALARRDGLAPEDVVIGALPDWLADEPDFAARAAAEIALRRALLPSHALAFLEPAMNDELGARWQAVVSALLPDAGDVVTILRRSHATALATRGMAQAAASLRASRTPPELTGVAAAHANEAVIAAAQTLEALAERGWQALVDHPLGIRTAGTADAVAERADAFDPLAVQAVSRVQGYAARA